MDVDASFAEYVAVRWSMLHRLAVLLVGDELAEELTETALVRAYASWPAVQEAASADQAVKNILVNTAVRLGGKHRHTDEGQHAPAAGDSDELWARISALPPRQRAVVVLLYYEDLSEAEIARALGCSNGTVKSDAFAALTTQIDLARFTTRDLRDELVTRADEAEVPLPPVDSLVPRAREERRRRTRRRIGWTAAAAAVVVAAVALAGVIGGNGPGPSRPPAPPALPTSLVRLPVGHPADVAYVSRRTLHVDGHEVALAARPSGLAETPQWVFLSYPTGTITRVDRATLVTATLTDSAAGPMVTDPGGDYVAWPVVAAGQAEVVLRPVDAEPVGTGGGQAFPARPQCCDNPFVVAGMTASGDLVASLPAASKAWVWETRAAGADANVREIEGLGNGVVDRVTANEVVVRNPPFHYAVGTLRGGAFLSTAEVSGRTADFGDPLVRRVLYVDNAGETHVRVRESSRRASRRGNVDVRLRLPVLAGGFAGARWEDEHYVLLDVADDMVPFGALVRCDVDTGACEIAARFDGPHLLAR